MGYNRGIVHVVFPQKGLVIMKLKYPVLLLVLAALGCGFPARLAATEIPAGAGPAITPVCTLPACVQGEVFTCPGECPGGCGTACATPTPWATELAPMIMCTAPACAANESYFCPGECPGGCGTTCATRTPQAGVTAFSPVCTPPACAANESYFCPGECPGGCGTTCATRTPSPDGGGMVYSPYGNCQLFPADNPWNRDISADPLDPNSDRYIRYMTASGNTFLHADFGSNLAWGFPYVVVPPDQPGVPINFTAYGAESDPGPYPIPPDAPLEAGSDRHVLVVRAGECRLYELYNAEKQGDGWNADSGAVFDLQSNALRPAGWTSADAAGLPILPGLVRIDEVGSGEIRHALRVTFSSTQRAYVPPATHFASPVTDPDAPPMGLRLRLNAGYDISRYTGQARVVLEALKKYGLIVADNGSNWFISGERNPNWNDSDLDQLKTVPGSAFEVVKVDQLIKGY